MSTERLESAAFAPDFGYLYAHTIGKLRELIADIERLAPGEAAYRCAVTELNLLIEKADAIDAAYRSVRVVK